MFGCEAGGGDVWCVEKKKNTTSGSHLDMREVVVVGDASKQWKEPKKPPLARVWTQGRQWWWVTCRKYERKPPPARIWMQGRWRWWVTCRNNKKNEKNRLWLTFGHEGGSGGGWRVKSTKKNHLQLAFGCEGGDSGHSLGLTGVSSRWRKNE